MVGECSEDGEAECGDAVECCFGDDSEGVLSVAADGVEASEDAVEDDDEAGGCFCSWDEFDLAAVAVSFDGGACADDDGGEYDQPVGFVVGAFAWSPEVRYDGGGCACELGAHRFLAAGVPESFAWTGFTGAFRYAIWVREGGRLLGYLDFGRQRMTNGTVQVGDEAPAEHAPTEIESVDEFLAGLL